MCTQHLDITELIQHWKDEYIRIFEPSQGIEIPESVMQSWVKKYHDLFEKKRDSAEIAAKLDILEAMSAKKQDELSTIRKLIKYLRGLELQ